MGSYTYEGYTFVSTVPVPYVDETGFHMPEFADVLAARKADVRSVCGQDLDLDPDTQDGVLVGIEAAAIVDTYRAMLAVYNSFSPSTAVGVGLSTVVKINGIVKKTASYSTQDVSVTGTAGIVVTNWKFSDGDNVWTLPPVVVIPFSGQVVVTATCQTVGAVSVSVGTVAQALMTTRGLQSIVFTGATQPGQPTESDAALRLRQSVSTMLPSQTVLDGIEGALVALAGVTRLKTYENDGDVSDSDGIPAHALCVVIDGGDEQTIADVIALKKTPGCGTYGDAVATVFNRAGVARSIRFFRPRDVTITWIVTVRARAGYTQDAQAAIQQAVSDWTNALGIGTGVSLARAYVPANLVGDAKASTFELISLAAARDGTTTTPVDVPIAFNEASFCLPNLVQVIATTS